MLLIDANLFLARDNTRDVHHLRAIELWEEIERGDYDSPFTTDYVFNEVVGVTFRKLGKERAIKLGEHLLKSIPTITIDGPMLRDAWNFFTQTELNLNVVDCTHLVAMKLANTISIATFDREFQKIKGITVIT